MTGEVMGAVLAGGRGRRIGGDKPSLEVGGQTMVRHAVDALRLARLDVTLVLRAHQPVPLTAHTFAVVRDEVENAGPLGGLHALLRWLPMEWALVASCDQPFLAPELLRELLSQARGDVDAVVGRPADLMEPLPGLYRRTCLPAIEEALARGERSFRDLLSSLRVRAVPAETLRQRDHQLLSYVNVNTPADLSRARATATIGDTAF
ncbi:MAG: molybdenum cofactor guanylyltransferase [Chloroflexi bacterium]|nr:molybdenum cofactor guanylyltransferase [Chloroflexota bacterium]